MTRLFITADQNIRYQQNLAGFRIAILELSTKDLRRIQAAAALIRSTIDSLQRAQLDTGNNEPLNQRSLMDSESGSLASRSGGWRKCLAS